MITIPVIIDGLRTMKDGGLKVTIHTQELTPDQVAGLMSMNNAFAYCALKPEPFTRDQEKAIGDLKADYDNTGKTPGQRLRGVLFKLYEQDHEGFSSFTLFYDHHMERIINHFKSKLP